MKGIWRKWLGLGAGVLVAAAPVSGADDDRVIARAGVPSVSPPVAVLAPAPQVKPSSNERPQFAESRPVTLGRPRIIDPEVRPIAFRDPAHPIIRAKGSELLPMSPGSRIVRTPVAATTFGMDNATLPQPGAAVADEGFPGPIVPGPAYTGTPVMPGMPVSPGMPGMPGMPVEMSYGSGINPDCFDVGDGVSHQFANLFFIDHDFLMWTMKGQNLPPLVTAGFTPEMLTPGSFGAQTLLGGQKVDMDNQYGYRVRAGFWIDRDHAIGVEGSYFFLGQGDMTFSTASTGVPALGIPFLNATGMESVLLLAGTGASGSVNARMLSRLWGAEANVRTNLLAGPYSHLDLIIGFRALGLDDSFELGYSSNVGTRNVFTTADSFASRNRYWGGQLGLDWERRSGRWSLNVIGKAGIGAVNQEVEIDGSGRFLTGAAPVGIFASTTNSGIFTRTEFAFNGEAAVKLGYQLSNHCRATLGYNFLYLNNVVRAGEQIDRVFSATRPAFTFNTSDFWTQGLTVGLEFKY